MRLLRLLLFETLLLLNLPGIGQVEIRGRVFFDKNDNGVWDRPEKGVHKVAVSNGDTVVLTDRQGYFNIPAEPGQHLFPVLPSGYSFSGTGVFNNRSWLVPDAAEASVATPSFPLVRIPVSKSFRLALVGDIQVGNDIEAGWANQTLFSQLVNRSDVQLMLTPGDLVNDHISLLEPLRKAMDKLPFPVWTAPGNHDRDTEPLPRDFTTYRRLFGAEDYGFFYGEVLFLVLNNVKTEGSRSYQAEYSDRQLRLVRQLLRLVPNKNQVVVCQHIPLIHTRNRDALLSLLDEKEHVLILSGHTHTTGKHLHSPACCELIAGAPCGSWWRGEKDSYGIPSALQSCGTPRNYFLIDFTNRSYHIHFQPLDGVERQADIWICGEDSSDLENPEFQSIPKGTVLVNLFAGCAETQVQMRIDDGPWQTLQHTPTVAPNVSRLIHWNSTAGYPTAFSTRIPLRRTRSPHIWQGTLPADLSPGVHTLTIQAYDTWGMNMEEKKIFYPPILGE